MCLPLQNATAPAPCRPEKADRAPSLEAGPRALPSSDDSGPGPPAAPAGDRLRLLPSGPDLVHGPTSRGDPGHRRRARRSRPRRPRPSRGDSASLERIASDRAPLPPRLARSACKRSACTAAAGGGRRVAGPAPPASTMALLPGRVAQRESARFTRERSLVRTQPRPSSAGAAPRRGSLSTRERVARAGRGDSARLARTPPSRRCAIA
jgi:hypothetical protein